MFKKILSFIVPIKIYQTKSVYNRSIEVTWANGELVIDSLNTNYSYGSLQRILRKGLNHIGFERVSKMEQVLVLGVAGGSVIRTLVDEINFKGKITGVEIDSDIIAVANKYFKLNEIPNLEITIDDAFEFVLKTKNKYDLIIIDIFQDTMMPNFLFEHFFTHRVCFLLKSKGLVLFNTMCIDENHNLRNKKYVAEFYENQFKIKTLPRIEAHNELIIIENVY